MASKILPSILPKNRDKCFYCKLPAQYKLDSFEHWLPVCISHAADIQGNFPDASIHRIVKPTRLDILVKRAVRVMKNGLETKS